VSHVRVKTHTPISIESVHKSYYRYGGHVFILNRLFFAERRAYVTPALIILVHINCVLSEPTISISFGSIIKISPLS